MRYYDMDDIYMEYEDLVEAGEIDPAEVSVEDYVADKLAEMADEYEVHND